MNLQFLCIYYKIGLSKLCEKDHRHLLRLLLCNQATLSCHDAGGTARSELRTHFVCVGVKCDLVKFTSQHSILHYTSYYQHSNIAF